MRLIAWNCAMGLHRKLGALAALRPDIAVLSEVACPDILRSKMPELAHVPMVWVGDNAKKGLGVLSFSGDALILDGSYRDANRFVAPVHVNGRSQFRLLAVWDHNDRKGGLNRRPGPLLRALRDSADFCRYDNLVLAGDFNNHPRWDRPGGPNNMSEITKQLVERNLTSLYHHQSGEAFGAESRSTYWYWRRQDKCYHIDYVFVSKAMLRRLIEFGIGSFEDWCLAGRSDHAPLIAEFTLPGGA
jgi:exodeoxyribonuclease-3